MPCLRQLFPVLAVVLVLGIARAEPDDAPAPVDLARLSERYVIEPGTEALFSDMLGSGETLPGGCTFQRGQIERTSVLATYTCSSGTVVLELLHPEMAPRGGVLTQRFAVATTSGTPPTGFVDAVADRIRAREAAFAWKHIDGGGGGTRWMAPIAVGVVVALLVFWALRRVAARRGRPA